MLDVILDNQNYSLYLFIVTLLTVAVVALFLLGWLRLIECLVFIFLASLFVNVSQVTYFFLYQLKIINYQVYNQLLRHLQSLWFACVNLVFGSTKLIVTGDEVPADENAILIANHQMDIDWWYLWAWAKKYDRHGDIKIGLKEELKFVPVFGWGMYFFDFLFISRAWAKDKITMIQKFQHWVDDKLPIWFILFPEGTTIQTRSMEMSKQYALKSNRSTFNYLLLPRTTGLYYAIKELRPHVRAIYDVTMAYPSYSGEIPTYEMGYTRAKDLEVPSFTSVLKGKIPEKVYLHIIRYDIETIPTEEPEFVKWLDNIWHDKDQRLKNYIEKQTLLLDTDK